MGDERTLSLIQGIRDNGNIVLVERSPRGEDVIFLSREEAKEVAKGIVDILGADAFLDMMLE